MRLALAVLFVAAAAAAAGAVERPKSVEVRERVNKAWDQGIERIWKARTEARCREEAKKNYSAIRFNKRRLFVKTCIEQARR